MGVIDDVMDDVMEGVVVGVVDDKTEGGYVGVTDDVIVGVFMGVADKGSIQALFALGGTVELTLLTSLEFCNPIGCW